MGIDLGKCTFMATFDVLSIFKVISGWVQTKQTAHSWRLLTSYQYLRSYQYGYRLRKMRTHGDFRMLSNCKTEPPPTNLARYLTQLYYCDIGQIKAYPISSVAEHRAR